jgi:hypothetical protein
VEAHLPLAIMLPGALGRRKNSGCTPFEMWKAAGELAGTASSGIKEDDVVLVQDYMMESSQLKALATEGGPQTKTPVMSCEHSRLARPSAELRRWGRNKLHATLGARCNAGKSQVAGGPGPT